MTTLDEQAPAGGADGQWDRRGRRLARSVSAIASICARPPWAVIGVVLGASRPWATFAGIDPGAQAVMEPAARRRVPAQVTRR